MSVTPPTPAPSTDPPTKPLSEKAKGMLTGVLDVFLTDGYAGASVDRLAAAAGVSKRTLYSHFTNKEGLFIAVIRHLTEKNRQLLFSMTMGPDLEASPDEVLRTIGTSMLERFSQDPVLITIMRLMIGSSGRFPELSKTFVREIQKPLLEQLSFYLAAHPQLNLPDPMVAARVFVGSMVHYLIIQQVMHGSEILPLESERMIEGVIHLLTHTHQATTDQKTTNLSG